MKETIVPGELNTKVISMWQHSKSKTAISKELHVCRKKVAQLIRMFEHKDFFDVKAQKNWLINE